MRVLARGQALALAGLARASAVQAQVPALALDWAQVTAAPARVSAAQASALAPEWAQAMAAPAQVRASEQVSAPALAPAVPGLALVRMAAVARFAAAGRRGRGQSTA